MKLKLPKVTSLTQWSRVLPDSQVYDTANTTLQKMQELRKLNTAEKTAEEAVLKLNIYFELF